MHNSLAQSAPSAGGTSLAERDRNRRAGTATESAEVRRRNQTLRCLVDGLLDHVRDLSETVDGMSPEEIDDAHQRFNHVAELMWAVITDEKNRPRRRARAGVTG